MNVLEKMVIVFILGPQKPAEDLAISLVTASSRKIGLIAMDSIIQGRRRGDPEKVDRLAVFLEETKAKYDQGIRVIVVTGFPQTVTDTAHIFECSGGQMMMVFSIPSDTVQRNDRSVIESVFCQHGKEIFEIDTSKNQNQQQRFMSNRINNLITSLEISALARETTHLTGFLQPVHAV